MLNPNSRLLVAIVVLNAITFTARSVEKYFSPLKTPYAKKEAIAIDSVFISQANVPQFGRVEFSVSLKATYDNPFDADDILLEARIKKPSGETITVPGFYYQPYSRSLQNNREVLAKQGDGEWRVRYAPDKTGEYIATVFAKDRNGSAQSKPVKFNCVKSDTPGFIRISKRNNKFFEFDNGKIFYPVGAKICWGGSRGTYDYDEWLKRYAEAGCNFGRLWLSPHWTTFALERPGKPEEGKGLSVFDLANAFRIEKVLEEAEKYGINIKLCIDSYNILRQKDGYPEWDRTPHNIKNGGLLNTPGEFWTHPEMERLYKNKLRYLVARYGAYANVMSWEFWNEVDIITGYNTKLVRDWHQRMARFLRSIDPYAHLITTSFANTRGDPEIDRLPEIEYVQTHHYGSADIVQTIANAHKQKAVYNKPHYVGEIGADAGGPRAKDDPGGYQVHDPLWVSIAVGCSGAAQPWWWDNLIHPNNLYRLYKPLNEFIKNIDWINESFKPAEFEIQYQNRPVPEKRKDLIIEGGPVSWGETEFNRPKTVIIDRSGVKSGLPVAGILHGTVNHPTKHNPVTFEITLPWATVLEVEVGGVSGYGGAALEITLNGKVVLFKDFPDTDNSTETITKYSGSYKIDIPAGKNIVVVNNPGKDWFMVSYKLRNAIEVTKPDILYWGLTGKTTVLGWIRHAQRTWQRVCAKKETFEKVPPTVILLNGLNAGRWRAEIWDTWNGNILQTTELNVQPRTQTRLTLPAFEHDIAFKIIR